MIVERVKASVHRRASQDTVRIERQPVLVLRYLATWTIRVWQHQSGPDDVESSIDVHGVRVLEWDYVDVVVWSQMTPHPLNSHVICNLREQKKWLSCVFLNLCWLVSVTVHAALSLVFQPPHLTPLDEKVPPSSDEVGSIEAGLVLRGHKLPLGGQLVSVLHCADGVVLKHPPRSNDWH